MCYKNHSFNNGCHFTFITFRKLTFCKISQSFFPPSPKHVPNNPTPTPIPVAESDQPTSQHHSRNMLQHCTVRAIVGGSTCPNFQSNGSAALDWKIVTSKQHPSPESSLRPTATATRCYGSNAAAQPLLCQPSPCFFPLSPQKKGKNIKILVNGGVNEPSFSTLNGSTTCPFFLRSPNSSPSFSCSQATPNELHGSLFNVGKVGNQETKVPNRNRVEFNLYDGPNGRPIRFSLSSSRTEDLVIPPPLVEEDTNFQPPTVRLRLLSSYWFLVFICCPN